MQDLRRAGADEQRGTQKSDHQAGGDPPVEVARAARNDRVEERHPQRDRYDEDARHPRRGVLLGPHHERVAPREQQHADNRLRAPVREPPRQPVAERERGGEQDGSGAEEPQPREQERRQLADPDLDGEIGRPPEDADHEIGDERLAAQRRHISPAPPG